MAKVKRTKKGKIRVTLDRGEAIALYNAISLDATRYDSEAQYDLAREIDRQVFEAI